MTGTQAIDVVTFDLRVLVFAALLAALLIIDEFIFFAKRF